MLKVNKKNKFFIALMLLFSLACVKEEYVINIDIAVLLLKQGRVAPIIKSYEKFDTRVHCVDTLDIYYDNFIINLTLDKSDTIFFMNFEKKYFKTYCLDDKHKEMGLNISLSMEYLGKPKSSGDRKYIVSQNRYTSILDSSITIDTLLLNISKINTTPFMIYSKRYKSYIFIPLGSRYGIYNIHLNKLGKWSCFFRRYRDCSADE